MRDKLNNPIRLEGQGTVLEEIAPKYFPYVIKWRNDKELNKFLNQPEELTLEKQNIWYEQRYLKDDTQGFFILVDKKNGVPFGTLGWTDMDEEKKQCIMGRLILGNPLYQNSGAFVESFFLLSDYLYNWVENIYIHVSPKNKKALRLNKKLGFVPNEKKIVYPDELFVQGDESRPQLEFFRDKARYEKVKKVMFTDIADILFA